MPRRPARRRAEGTRARVAASRVAASRAAEARAERPDVVTRHVDRVEAEPVTSGTPTGQPGCHEVVSTGQPVQ
ncbi:hypothetical protein [Streptomyces hayashii]|uniref:hypothetical protein n=1 Tax=Streptomyces hayashii TaxID=2839966 RepID=UPI00403C5F06